MLLVGIMTVFILPIGLFLFAYFFIKEFLPKKKEIKKTEKVEKIINYENVIDIKTRKILHWLNCELIIKFKKRFLFLVLTVSARCKKSGSFFKNKSN